MKALIIYYNRDDDLVINYVKDFVDELFIYSSEPKIAPYGYKVYSGNLENVLDDLKNKVDFVAFKERENYSMDFLRTGNLFEEVKKRNMRSLIIH